MNIRRNWRVSELDDRIVVRIDPGFDVGDVLRGLLIDFDLPVTEEALNLLFHHLHVLFVFDGHVSDPLVSDALQVIGSLADILLGL